MFRISLDCYYPNLLLPIAFSYSHIEFMWPLILAPLLTNALELRAVKTEISQNLPHILRQQKLPDLGETNLKPGQHWFQSDEEGRVTVPWTVTGGFENSRSLTCQKITFIF